VDCFVFNPREVRAALKKGVKGIPPCDYFIYLLHPESSKPSNLMHHATDFINFSKTRALHTGQSPKHKFYIYTHTPLRFPDSL